MAQDIYEKLAKHLDNLPGAFPRTKSSVELRILRRLFTPEEAKLAVHLALIPEKAPIIARRAKMPVEKVDKMLQEMNMKGLIIGFKTKDQPMQYIAQQFIVGFWESQVNNLTKELIEEFEEYLPFLYDPATWAKTPQMRTIPVGASIEVKPEAMSYEKA